MATVPYGTSLNERLGSYQDRIWEAQSLLNNGTITSGVFQFGKVQGEVELAVIANTEITILDTFALTVEVFYDDAEDGAFANSYVAKAFLASGGSIVIAAGDEFALSTPETNIGQYGKIEITTTGDQTLDSVNAKLFRTA
jgi:hypothetical protein